jgi:hypothetical protein
MYSYEHSKAAPCRNLDGVTIKPPARLSAQFLMQNKLPIWVVTAIPPQSILTFTIKQGGGLPGQALRLQRSKLPQCITAEYPHEALAKGGRDIWNAIDKGMLVLVWPSDAEQLVGGKQAETERVQVSKWSALNAEKSPEIKEHERIIRQAKDAEKNAQLEADGDDEEHEIVNARVMDIVARSKAGEVKLDKAIAEFDDMGEIMTKRDYAYAIANVRGGKLREWLQGALAKGAAPDKPKKVKKSTDDLVKGKKPARDDNGVFDDSEPEMTDEEKEAEALAEMEARQRQRIGG